LSDEVSGKVERLFTSLKEGDISLIAYKDSVLGTSLVKSDEKGLFTFKELEYPAGTQYIVQAKTPRGSKNAFIEIEPAKSLPTFLNSNINHNQKPILEKEFISKVNEKTIIEDGIRSYNLDEVVVTAKKKLKLNTESPYYSISSSRVITSADIEKINPLSLFDLLRRIPGITISGEEVKYRTGTPMVILDNVPEDDFDYTRVDVSDVKDVFISPPELVATIFGSRGVDGAVVINTKKGGGVEKRTLNRNIQIITPIGYQQTVEFYSPVYATKEQKEQAIPDFRTTVYWKPNVQFDNSGTAKVSFYAADYLTHYGIVIEGCSSDGHLIHSSNFEVPVTTHPF
ncbi:MAG: TonB-dependent receptor, partial [Phocaeicola sp.]